MQATKHRYRVREGKPTRLEVDTSHDVHMVFVTLDQAETCEMTLASDGVELGRRVGREMRVEFAAPMERRLRELYLVGPGEGYANALIVYEAAESPKRSASGSVTKLHFQRVTDSRSGSLTSASLRFELHLGSQAVFQLTAIGLEDPDNDEALREALASARPEQLEGCLPLTVTELSTGEVELASADYVEVAGSPSSHLRCRVPSRLWREALKDLAAQYEGLVPRPQVSEISPPLRLVPAHQWRGLYLQSMEAPDCAATVAQRQTPLRQTPLRQQMLLEVGVKSPLRVDPERRISAVEVELGSLSPNQLLCLCSTGGEVISWRAPQRGAQVWRSALDSPRRFQELYLEPTVEAQATVAVEYADSGVGPEPWDITDIGGTLTATWTAARPVSCDALLKGLLQSLEPRLSAGLVDYARQRPARTFAATTVAAKLHGAESLAPRPHTPEVQGPVLTLSGAGFEPALPALARSLSAERWPAVQADLRLVLEPALARGAAGAQRTLLVEVTGLPTP